MRAATSTCIAVAALVAPRVALAEAERSHVTVHVTGDPAAVRAMSAVLRERIANAGLDATIDEVASIDRAAVLEKRATADEDLAAIWIDASGTARVALLLVDIPGDRVLVREIAREANPEIAWEEVGHIVEAALGALKAGERIGVERAELAAPAPPPAPAPAARPEPAPPPPEPLPLPPRPREARIAFDASAFYLVRAWGDGLAIASGPGVTLGLERHAERARCAVLFAGEYRLPSTVDTQRATVRFEGGALHVLAQGDLALSRRSALGLGVGAGIELVHAEARDLAPSTSTSTSTSTNVTSAGERVGVVPSLRGLVRYVLSTPALRGYAGLGVDVPMKNTRYVVQGLAEPIVLFEPWSVRPFLVVGVATP